MYFRGNYPAAISRASTFYNRLSRVIKVIVDREVNKSGLSLESNQLLKSSSFSLSLFSLTFWPSWEDHRRPPGISSAYSGFASRPPIRRWCRLPASAGPRDAAGHHSWMRTGRIYRENNPTPLSKESHSTASRNNNRISMSRVQPDSLNIARVLSIYICRESAAADEAWRNAKRLRKESIITYSLFMLLRYNYVSAKDLSLNYEHWVGKGSNSFHATRKK